jgi:DNA polymerase-3 subunit epsilon
MGWGWLRAIVGDDVTRWAWALRLAGTPLGRYYRLDTATRDSLWWQVEFLAVDLETTGLDPRQDAIVSIGWVPVSGGRVRLDGAAHRLVRPEQGISDASAVIHGILEDHVREAPPLAEVLPEFLAALAGRVPIVHHAAVERGFLDAACEALYGAPLVVPYVDTLALERRRLDRRGQVARPGDLRLHACRDRYGLPRYRAHNALVDALAAAELLLAQVAHMDPRKTRLGDLFV